MTAVCRKPAKQAGGEELMLGEGE